MPNSPVPRAMLPVLVALLPACATVPREPGFADVRRAVHERTGAEIRWQREDGPPGEKAAREQARALLARDMSADDAVAVALLLSPRVQITLEALEVTRGELALAAAPHNPLLGVEARFPRQVVVPLEIGLTQAIVDLFQVGVRRRLAEAAWEPARLRAADEVMAFIAEVRSAFYEAQAAGQAADLLARSVEVGDAATALSDRQHEAGNISDLDFENARAALDQALLELDAAKGEAAVRRERVNALLGLSGDDTAWRMTPVLPDPAGVEPSLDGLERAAESRWLDLLAALHEIEAAEKAIGVAKAEGFADASAGVHFEREPENTKTTGPALEIPLPVFPRGRAARVRAEAAWRQSRERYAAMRAEAEAEIRAFHSRLVTARSRFEAYRDRILPRRERIVSASQSHYNFMLLGPDRLLAARQAEVLARRDSVAALRDYWLVRVELERAVGGPLGDVSMSSEATPAQEPQAKEHP